MKPVVVVHMYMCIDYGIPLSGMHCTIQYRRNECVARRLCTIVHCSMCMKSERVVDLLVC